MILKVQNLSKSFGGVKAVQNFSFTSLENSITSLIGPNGAGKTTVFNLISRVIEADSGTIIFNDIDILKLKPHQLILNGISRTFQNIALFNNMSLIENIMLGGHSLSNSENLNKKLFNSSLCKYLFSFNLGIKEDAPLKKKAEYLLEFAGLKDKINEDVSKLAFGQQRLAEISRALMSDAELLLFDEPAAGLNPKETEDLGTLLLKIKELGKSILLVEHDMNLVMNISNKIVVMNFGVFLAEGTPTEISLNTEVISAYLGNDEVG